MNKHGCTPSHEGAGENEQALARFEAYERAVTELTGKTISYKNEEFSLWRTCTVHNVLMPDNPSTSRFILVAHDGRRHTIADNTKIWIGKAVYIY